MFLISESKLQAADRNKLKDSDFGLPKMRKYPLNDAEHVHAAIKMFKFCPKENRKELMVNIEKAAKKFNIDVDEKKFAID